MQMAAHTNGHTKAKPCPPQCKDYIQSIDKEQTSVALGEQYRTLAVGMDYYSCAIGGVDEDRYNDYLGRAEHATLVWQPASPYRKKHEHAFPWHPLAAWIASLIE